MLASQLLTAPTEESQEPKISDAVVYASRLDAFREFRSAFYAGVDPDPLAHGQDIVFFDYQTLGLAVVGFSSWHGNDCFCDVGEIDVRLVALSRSLLAKTKAPVAVAVWHHNLVGGPRARDYMDQRVVHQLIDYGFSLGLHGHQHYPGAAPYELRLPNRTSMAVISAGSLAVGDRELPMGERRQFNVVVLDPQAQSVTIHVRAMSAEGVFTGSHRDDFGGNTSIFLPLLHSPARPSSPSAVRVLDDAMNAARRGDYSVALKLLSRVDPSHDIAKRQVKIEALRGLGLENELITLLEPPQSGDELIQLVAMRLKRNEVDSAELALNEAQHLLDTGTARDARARINARKVEL